MPTARRHGWRAYAPRPSRASRVSETGRSYTMPAHPGKPHDDVPRRTLSGRSRASAAISPFTRAGPTPGVRPGTDGGPLKSESWLAMGGSAEGYPRPPRRRQHSGRCALRLRGETLDDPVVVGGLPVADAIVQPARASLPELELVRRDAIA